MEFRQLSCFVAVADELSVSRCAIKAEISKDSLSLRM
jgi:DNA-binding transcriptional LysR family regulator